MESRRVDPKNKGIKTTVNIVSFVLFVVFVFISGCKSGKNATISTPAGESISYNQLIQNLNNNVGKYSSVYYPKVRYTISQNGSTNQFTGSLSIKKGKEIFATVNAFLGIEVARVLLNKDSVIIKSNFEKKLYVLDYNQMIKKFGLSGDFSTIENVLCYQLAMYKANLYDYQLNENDFLITPKDRIKSKVDYDHLTAKYIDDSYKITNISYCAKTLNDCLNVTYNNFSSQKKFVNPTSIKVQNDKEEVRLEMVMNKANYDTTFDHKLGNVANYEIVRY